MSHKVINIDRFVAPDLKKGKRTIKPTTYHGLSNHKDYQLWNGLFTRCYNPNVKIFKYYGGRGISVCERWDNFKNFLDDMGDRPEGMQLDRIDNNGNYEPNNCRWVTPKENNAHIKGDIPDQDMLGKRFGKWLVISSVKHKSGHRYYLCKCDCGIEKIISGGELRRKRTPTTQCIKCKNKEHSIIHKGWLQRKLNATLK